MIKSRKILLDEANEELIKIRKKITLESFSSEEWWDELELPRSEKNSFISVIKRYRIKKNQILTSAQKFEEIIESNGKDSLTDLTKSKKYGNILKYLEKIKSNSKYNKINLDTEFKSLPSNSIEEIFYKYNMDHLMVLEYILQNKKMPTRTDPRQYYINSIAIIHVYNTKYDAYKSTFWKDLLLGIAKYMAFGPA